MNQPSRRTAVVVDRYPLWTEAVECVLRRVDVDVVGKATTGADALELVRQLRPDLLITEIRLGDGDTAGLTCLREARRNVPDLRSVVLSMGDGEQVDTAFNAGAVAHVLKSADPDDLASAVRLAFAQSVHLAPSDRLWNGRSKASSPGVAVDRADLTKREREILQLVAEGHSNAQLARMLWVTEQTVKFHLSNVYRKLDVANRTEAARWAQVHGLVPTPGQIAAA